MNTLFKLAWRNIWRNKRRTFITAASIFFAVLLASLMQSIQRGAWNKMVESLVSSFSGYAQAHTSGYNEEQTIEKAFAFNTNLQELPNEIEGLEGFVPRLTSFALASYKLQTKGVLVVGTDPESEHGMTRLRNNIVAGEYFKEGENSVLIVEGVAKTLKVEIGDTLVMISSGYHGVNAAGKYCVKGILKFASPLLNRRMVFLPLSVAQNFYGAEGLITRLSLDIEDREKVPQVVQAVQKNLGEEFEVMNWEQLMPELSEAREVDTAGNFLVLIILYIIIGFGIFGTILMMTKEREYEFGVLTAIGMKKWKLGVVIWLEIVMLGLLGAFLGIVGSIPVVGYFSKNPLDFSKMEGMSDAYEKFGFEPIFPAAFQPEIFLTHAIIVFILTSILAIYPLLKIKGLKPVQAMRG
jgi:ABC-type lipoprotein release transport system permease subunit